MQKKKTPGPGQYQVEKIANQFISENDVARKGIRGTSSFTS